MMGRPSPFNNVKYYNTSSITSLQTITNIELLVIQPFCECAIFIVTPLGVPNSARISAIII